MFVSGSWDTETESDLKLYMPAFIEDNIKKKKEQIY